ncbi:MAG: insulinase family protein [Acidobacteriota bacterium]|nr:insulinase family protein [Acidobacteriota bacterium]
MATHPALDRSQPPSPEAARSFSFPRFESHRIEPGLRVLLAPIHRTPLVDIRLLTQAGAQFDSAPNAGLAHLVSAVQDEGTQSRTADQIARAIEQLGGYLSTGVNWETAAVSCGVLAEHLDTALDLVNDVAAQASFPEAEVDRLESQIVAEIERRRTQPSALANLHFARAVFGDGVYGRRIIGSAETVMRFERQHLAEFHKNHFSARGATLIICGDIDPDILLPRLEHLCAAWPVLEPPALPSFHHRELEGIEITIVDRPDAPQTELRLGHVGLSRHHPDYIPAAVMNCLLGGRFMSRININLREKHGYTYGAGSSFAKRSGAGPFVVSTAVGTEHTAAAATEILREIERLQREAVEEVELAETKSYLLGTFPYSTQTLEGVTARLYDLAVFELPDDYYSTYEDSIRSVDMADVQRCAQTHLSTDRIAIVAVGPVTELGPALERLGPVRSVPATSS